jgi:hypothetical protein
VAAQQQLPDGRWVPAVPLGYQPGWDVERDADGRWEVFRTTRHASTQLATGKGRLRLVWTLVWDRFRHGYPARER